MNSDANGTNAPVDRVLEVNVRSTPEYDQALEHSRYENQITWQVFSAFVLAESVFSAAILNTLCAREANFLPTWHIGYFLAGALGLFSCFSWYSSHARNSRYRDLRVAQARARDQSNSGILIEGEAFANNQSITVGKDTFQHEGLGRTRAVLSGDRLIQAFIVFYSFIIVLSGPWIFLCRR